MGQSVSRPRALTRRALVGYGLSGAAIATFRNRPAPSLAAPSLGDAQSGDPPRTWLLAAAGEVRPSAPGTPGEAELAELIDRQGRRGAEQLESIHRWNDRTVVLPWTQVALDLIQRHKLGPVRAGRTLASLQTTLADVLVACQEARTAHPRPAPATLDSVIVPLSAAASSSYPSEQAAVATAAAAVLAYHIPKEPAERLRELATEAAESRLWAGLAFRSDLEAGQAIGQAVADRAIARDAADEPNKVWDGTGRLEGAGYWQPTPPDYVPNPVDPLAGTWRPWVLASGDQFRPPTPPAYQSPAWQAELAAVQEAVARRTPEQEMAVHAWAGGAGTVTPAGLWLEIARDLIVDRGLDAPAAARVLALTSVAMADGFVCCWDAKYTYWLLRPITADPTLDVLIPTPPFPSYTSGHSTISTAAATVLGHLFPAAHDDLMARANEAKDSRLWAGIHHPIDNEMGALGGGVVGRLVVNLARSDGSGATY